jgi:methionine synthase I (cobalamin-dependent)
MVGQLTELRDSGAWLVGGCCGTGPDHIRAFRSGLDEAASN